jgi:DNA-binding Lrp family transcriptional regulator
MNNVDTKNARLLDWLAGFGCAGSAELADLLELSEPATNARLRRLERERLLARVQLLHGKPALWAITSVGLRATQRSDLGPPRISSSGFAHALECARAARALERSGLEVHSERELRALERAGAKLIASAELDFRSGAPDIHRPDLVCLRDRALPIAVEVELTVKAPERLRRIVRGWARCRRVACVVYYAAPAAGRALERAVAIEQAAAAVHVLALDQLGRLPEPRSTSPIPSAP